MTKVELLSNNYPHFINSALAATNERGHKFYEDTIIKHRNQLEWRYCPQILYQKKFGEQNFPWTCVMLTAGGGTRWWVGVSCEWGDHTLEHVTSCEDRWSSVTISSHGDSRRWGEGQVSILAQFPPFYKLPTCKSDKGDNFVKSPMIKTDRINKRLCCWLYCLLTVQ